MSEGRMFIIIYTLRKGRLVITDAGSSWSKIESVLEDYPLDPGKEFIIYDGSN